MTEGKWRPPGLRFPNGETFGKQILKTAGNKDSGVARALYFAGVDAAIEALRKNGEIFKPISMKYQPGSTVWSEAGGVMVFIPDDPTSPVVK